jgi:hypothetical protein
MCVDTYQYIFTYSFHLWFSYCPWRENVIPFLGNESCMPSLCGNRSTMTGSNRRNLHASSFRISKSRAETGNFDLCVPIYLNEDKKAVEGKTGAIHRV